MISFLSDVPIKESAIKAHNKYRQDHSAPPVQWSDKLAKVMTNYWLGDGEENQGCTFGIFLASYWIS